MIPLLITLIFFNTVLAVDYLTFAVLSSGSPVMEYKRFKALSGYISQKTGIPVKVKIVGKYKKLLELYQGENIDISISCPVVFYKIKEKHNVEGIAVVKIDGMVLESGVIVVKKDSPIKKIEDLKGAKITLGSSICASNCIMPLYILKTHGITYKDVPDMWSSGTDRAAILAVIAGLADAAGVKEESALLFLDKGIKILAKSPYVPRYIVALSKDLPENLREKIKKALYNLKDRSILKELGIDGFEKPTQKMFKLIKNYNQVLESYPFLQ